MRKRFEDSIYSQWLGYEKRTRFETCCDSAAGKFQERLFRSEGERKVKRNLMIFVTASKVSPNGRIVSTQSFK